ncbi:SETMAR [Cordylochernes scorpioides]|uniref:SETMAR n=1 Tax=Cordylochernes scorpioides TaxID=51811 RepID=A0ABY6LGA4_9ARAC|nr:SETMAR [Cordylochernes scorpioides]
MDELHVPILSDLDDQVLQATPSTINAVENLILEDRKISIFTIADNLNISYGTMHTIINEQLQFRKICCIWIPHFLNLDQKLNRIRVSKGLLKRYEKEGDHFLDQIVTGDESWCYHYDPSTKRASMEWKRGDSLRQKKSGLNVRPKELKGKRFDSDEDVQKVVQDFFHTLPKSAYKEGIYKLPERWRRCIESQDSPDSEYNFVKLSEAIYSKIRNPTDPEAVKKSATDGHRLLCEAYGKHALSIKSCEYWFWRFKSGDFDTRDKERGGRPIKFEDAELEALLDEDSSQTQEELAETLGVTQKAISNRLKVMVEQKQGNWVPYEPQARKHRAPYLHVRTTAQKTKSEGFFASNRDGGRKVDSLRQPKAQKIVG